jgi:uncharacterized membrane protein
VIVEVHPVVRCGVISFVLIMTVVSHLRKEPTMLFLAILFLSTALAWLVGRRRRGWRDHARRGLAVAMVVAGLSHFARSEPFVQHLPGWVPAAEALVYITGAIEVALGVALLRSREHRVTAGRLLAAFLVAVLPANIYVAVEDVDVTGQPGGAYAWIRLPLQGLFIAWALVCTQPDRAGQTRTSPKPAPESAQVA